MARKAKRFYNDVTVCAVEGGYAVLLDGRQLKTPGKKTLLTNQAIANFIAAEWDAQTEFILPETMPVTRLLNVAIERTPDNRDALVSEVRKYSGTDVLCYRSVDRPLFDRQTRDWDPVLEWAKSTHGIALKSTTGIVAVTQDEASMDKVADYARQCCDVSLTLLTHFTAVFGSAVLAIAVMDTHLEAGKALSLSRLDELFQIERWGQDELANERSRDIEVETLALSKLIGQL